MAKGQRLIAQQIKDIAEQHNVMIIENPPLARSLFKQTKNWSGNSRRALQSRRTNFSIRLSSQV